MKNDNKRRLFIACDIIAILILLLFMINYINSNNASQQTTVSSSVETTVSSSVQNTEETSK